MIFKEAYKELQNHKRVWHPKWNKTGFIFKEIFFGEVFHLALWDNLVQFPSEPRFKGTDDRLYSRVGTFYLGKKVSSDYVVNIVRQCVAEHFAKAQYSLAMMGYKIEKNDLEDEWEVL